MCSGPTAKLILIVLNALFVLCGAGLMGIGIWMQVDPMFSHYLHVVDVAATNSLIDWAAWIFIFVGAIAFVISGIGICGACRESQCLIFMYIVLLFVMVAGEVIAGSLALVYRAEVEGHLESAMQKQLQHDYGDHRPATRDAWDFLQVHLSCCGASNYTDYVNSSWANQTQPTNGTERTVPDTCCHLKSDDYINPKPTNFEKCQSGAETGVHHSNYLNVDGCYDELRAWLNQHSSIMIVLGFGIAAIQLLGFVSACCLRRQIRAETYAGSHKL